MIKKILKNKITIILILIIIVLFVIKIIFKKSPNQTLQINNPNIVTPTIINKNDNDSNSKINNNDEFNFYSYPTLQPKEETISEINYEIPLSQFLPYQGDHFIASRYIEANNIEIIVYDKSKTDLAKTEVQKWLTKNGVDKLDRFTIVYK